MHNPMRYGQSLIADASLYRRPDGTVLDLESIARRVLVQVNRQISQKRYHLLFNNHRTSEKSSRHKEQRKSATYYALCKLHIPAFGVETSKSLPSMAMKVRHHALVINAFMQLLGIVPDQPKRYLARPALKYLVVSVNDGLPVVLGAHNTLKLQAGDRLLVSHIEANYERGLTADVLGLGSMNDTRRPLVVQGTTAILVRKDGFLLARIPVQVGGQRSTSLALRGRAMYFLLKVQGKKRLVESRGRLRVVKGDRVQIVDVLSNLRDQSGLRVNLKGFVPKGVPNRGEDRGYVVNTARELMSRWSTCPRAKDRRCFLIEVSKDQLPVGSMTLEVVPARLDYLVLRRGGQKLVYFRGETVRALPGERLKVLDLKTNVSTGRDLVLALEGGGRRVPLKQGLLDAGREPMRGLLQAGGGGARLVVLRQDQAIGHIQLRFGVK